MGCLFMEGEIGFCCLMTAVAYVSALPCHTNKSPSGGKQGFHKVSLSWPVIGADFFFFRVT